MRTPRLTPFFQVAQISNGWIVTYYEVDANGHVRMTVRAVTGEKEVELCAELARATKQLDGIDSRTLSASGPPEAIVGAVETSACISVCVVDDGNFIVITEESIRAATEDNLKDVFLTMLQK